MMQANWIKSTQPERGGRKPARYVSPSAAQNENGHGERMPRHPIWPLLVILFGLLASAAWGVLLLWLIWRW